MALLLSTRDLSKSFGARPLFSNISMSFDDAERTGMIGPNGAGKSTLLKVLAGLEPSDSGEIVTRRNLKLGYLAQSDTFPEGATVENVVVAAAANTGGDEHEHHIAAAILLDKMGFKNFDQPAAELSGGWRKRLAIARQMIQKPDLLLLDEPTNHLDLEGILWLEKMLLSSNMAFVVISHDRAFLERVTNRTVELSRAYADGYFSVNGPYSQFVEKQAEYLLSQQSRQQSLASNVREEIEWLRRGPKARGTKAKGRIDQAHEMMAELSELKTRNNQGGTAGIDFSATDRKTRKLISMVDVAKSFGDRPLLKDVNLVLSPGTKLGLIGPNGSGKSTLIKLLSGQLVPDSGVIKRADALKVVVFDQTRAQLDPNQSLRHALSESGEQVVFQGRAQHIVGWAQRFLFRTEQLDLPVSQLSGGEQARVMVARMMLEPADVLILDEPTNDLDIASLNVIEQSLESFPGALVLVTHDRFMLERLSTVLLGLDGRGNSHLITDIDQYLRWRESTEPSADKPVAKAASPAPEKPAVKKLTYMEQRELEKMESAVHEAEEELATAHAEAAEADWTNAKAIGERVAAAQAKVDSLYARWQELEDRASAAKA